VSVSARRAIADLSLAAGERLPQIRSAIIKAAYESAGARREALARARRLAQELLDGIELAQLRLDRADARLPAAAAVRGILSGQR